MAEDQSAFMRAYHLTSAIARLRTAREVIRVATSYARPVADVEASLMECLKQVHTVETNLVRELLKLHGEDAQKETLRSITESE